MKRVNQEDNQEEQLLSYNKELIEEFFTLYVNHDLSRSLLSEDVNVANKLNEELFLQHQKLLPLENIVGSQFHSKY
jgi:C4-type Zn-finger protein